MLTSAQRVSNYVGPMLIVMLLSVTVSATGANSVAGDASAAAPGAEDKSPVSASPVEQVIQPDAAANEPVAVDGKAPESISAKRPKTERKEKSPNASARDTEKSDTPTEALEEVQRRNPLALTLTESVGDVGADGQQRSGGQQSVSLGDVLTEVWRTNPQAQKAELAVQAAGYDISASRTGYYPYVAIQNEQPDKGNSSGLVRVIQPLWSGGLTSAQVDGAKAQLKTALADLNRTRLQLGLNTVDTYLAVVSATEQSRQWQNYIDELRQLLKVIQRRADEGVAPQSDVQTARTRLSQAEAGYQSSVSQVEANRAQLAALLNYEPGGVSWPDDNRRLTDEEMDTAAAANIKAHPDSQYAQGQVEQLQATARAAKASIWPTISAEYRRALQDYKTESGNNDTFLLSMQYQTDSGLRAYRQYAADNQRVESSRAALEAANRGVAASIKVARTQRRASEAQFTVQVQAAESARALVDSFLRQFEVGRKSWLEVLTAQRDANDAILSAISVRRDFWAANGHLALQGLLWRRLSDGAPDINAIAEHKETE